MDKKHLCSRKQSYLKKSAILMPDGHTYGLQAKAIPPSSSLMICRQVRAKMDTCVRWNGDRSAFLARTWGIFSTRTKQKGATPLPASHLPVYSFMVLRITLPPCGHPRGRLP